MILFKDLTTEERIPVYLSIMQSAIATAFNDCFNRVPDLDVIHDLTNKAFEQLPRTQKEWIFKYFDGNRALKNVVEFMESVSDADRPNWTLIDKHEDPMQDQGELYLDVKHMPQDDLLALMNLLTVQVVLSVFSETPQASAEMSVDKTLDCIWACACAFIEDSESREVFYDSLSPTEEVTTRIFSFLETFNTKRQLH